jgi:hypothetical protein
LFTFEDYAATKSTAFLFQINNLTWSSNLLGFQALAPGPAQEGTPPESLAGSTTKFRRFFK